MNPNKQNTSEDENKHKYMYRKKEEITLKGRIH